MVPELLEKALCPQILDDLFERSAKTQYTRELLFSTVVNRIRLVVCAAHQASSEEIGVSVTTGIQQDQWYRTKHSLGARGREVAGQMEATIQHRGRNNA